MKKISSLTVLLLATIFILPLHSQTSIQGDWLGKLKVQGIELRIIFHIVQEDDGSYTAAMDSPDQGALGIPVSKVNIFGDTLILEVAAVAGKYTGTLDTINNLISGTWKQGGRNFDLPLKPFTEEDEVKRPQEPKPPFPYNSEDISFQNVADSIKFAGTLTLPRSTGPFPAVVLISGSGAQDRNEEIFQHKPFMVIADFLTRRGIAVLRVDDRGVGGSEGNISESTTKDFAGDVHSAMLYLKTRKQIDSARIGLIGHSEGGIVAPLVAADYRDVAFIVMMAGTGLPGEDILYAQGELILKANGSTNTEITKSRNIQEKLFTIVKSSEDEDVIEKKLYKYIDQQINELSDEERSAIGNIENHIQNQMRQINNPWFRFFLTHDPRPALKQVECPVLAINGELDLQVPALQNIEAIKMALKQGKNPPVTTKIFPGLNHLFQTAKTGSPAEYGIIEETINPAVLKKIGDWILNQK